MEAKLKVMLSQDSDKVKEIKGRLKDNDGYCPCSIEKIPETKCMCKEFRDQSYEGSCHCGLYYKELV